MYRQRGQQHKVYLSGSCSHTTVKNIHPSNPQRGARVPYDIFPVTCWHNLFWWQKKVVRSTHCVNASKTDTLTNSGLLALCFWLHNLPECKIDSWLCNTSHFWNAMSPVLLSAAFHDEHIPRTQVITPLVSVILIASQQETTCSSKGHRTYKPAVNLLSKFVIEGMICRVRQKGKYVAC